MILTELLPIDTRCNTSFRIPFEHSILKENIKELTLTIKPEKDVMYRWYISTIAKNIESGSCLCIVETNNTKLKIDTFITECLKTSRENIIRDYKELDNIKYETYNAVMRFLEIVKEKRRLDNLHSPKDLHQYFDIISVEYNPPFLKENLTKICNGNYINAVHDTEEKKLFHFKVLKDIILNLNLNKTYTDNDIKYIIDDKYNNVYPKLKYLYISCVSKHIFNSLSEGEYISYIDRTELIRIKK